MRRFGLILAVGLVLGAGVLLFRWLFPGDETRIRHVITQAAEAVSWEPQAGGLDRLTGPARLAALCAPDITVIADFGGERRIRGREEVRGAAAAARAGAGALRVALADMAIQVAPDRQSASANLVAAITTDTVREPYVQELRLQFVRLDGAWLIQRVEPVKGFGM